MNPFSDFFPKEVFVHFSDRSQDFTLADGQVDLTQDQKKYLAGHLDASCTGIFYARQVHGKKIINVTKKDLPVKAPIPEADGFLTNVPGIALAVRTADCVPVFIYDPVKKAIALAHAGWRGTQANIVGQAVKAMTKQWQSAPRDLLAALGPCIQACCYEVGKDFQAIFPAETTEQNHRIFFDMVLANKNQLRQAGVPETQIRQESSCTCCDGRFFSFRREKALAGRHISVLMLAR